MLNMQQMKRTVLGVALLATLPVQAATINGGALSCGNTALTVTVSPSAHSLVCGSRVDTIATDNTCDYKEQNLTLGIDSVNFPIFELDMTIGDILANNTDSIIALMYSTQLLPSPVLPTPNSYFGMDLDFEKAEILSIIDIPAQTALKEPQTLIGTTNPSPRSQMSFKVNLEADRLLKLIGQDKDKIYLQAIMMKANDFYVGQYNKMYLSPVTTLNLIQRFEPECNGITAIPAKSGNTSPFPNILR
jgi:hypothetical protein